MGFSMCGFIAGTREEDAVSQLMASPGTTLSQAVLNLRQCNLSGAGLAKKKRAQVPLFGVVLGRPRQTVVHWN